MSDVKAPQIIRALGLTRYAEIGLDKGATVGKVAKAMGGQGTIHLFDFRDKCMSVMHDMGSRFPDMKFISHPNSLKIKDSYNWSLMKLLRKPDDKRPVFDYVYLDGAHTWEVDGLTFYLVDQLLAPGGFIEFDDYNWTLQASIQMHKRRDADAAQKRMARLRTHYTDEQLAEPHVKQVIDLLVKRHPNYDRVIENRVYRKTHYDRRTATPIE